MDLIVFYLKESYTLVQKTFPAMFWEIWDTYIHTHTIYYASLSFRNIFEITDTADVDGKGQTQYIKVYPGYFSLSSIENKAIFKPV